VHAASGNANHTPMTIYELKPAFQNLLRPICRKLASAGITPNQITLAALALSAGWGALITIYRDARWPLWGMSAILFLRMALNAIDGMLAREHAMKSPLGAFLNELGDVISDAALYLPLALVPAFSPWPVYLAVLLSAIGELAGVISVQIGASRRYDGPMGKSDRAFVFGLLALLAGLGLPTDPWLPMALWCVCGLLALTVLNRMRRSLQELSGKK
jgi:CDP-diacylglycerol---glycerol-3-phosphate 3-phosphatidyltransferase